MIASFFVRIYDHFFGYSTPRGCMFLAFNQYFYSISLKVSIWNKCLRVMSYQNDVQRPVLPWLLGWKSQVDYDAHNTDFFLCLQIRFSICNWFPLVRTPDRFVISLVPRQHTYLHYVMVDLFPIRKLQTVWSWYTPHVSLAGWNEWITSMTCP